MTIEQFLIGTYNKGLWKDIKKYNEAVVDAKTVSPDVWNKKWSDYLMTNEYLVDDYTKSKINETSKPLPVRLRNYFGDDQFNPNKIKRNYIRQNFFSDVPKDEFNRVLDQMKSNYDYELKLREEEAGKIRRKKEVEDWGNINKSPEQGRNLINYLLTSDYEKQRYINDPKSALFGKEAPELGQAPETRWGSVGDLGAGMVAGVADVATTPWPVVNVIAGPSIRAARDLFHYGTGSEYQKDLTKFGKDLVFDYGTAGAANVFANARRLSRGLTNLAPQRAAKYADLVDEANSIREGIKQLDNSKALNITDFATEVNYLPESPLKQDLLSEMGNITQKKFDANKLNNIIEKYRKDLTPEQLDLQKYVVNEQLGKVPATSYMERVLTTEPLKTKADKLAYGIIRAGDAINKGHVGTSIVMTTPNIPGKGSVPSIVETGEKQEEFERAKNAFRAQNELNWERFGKSFKPDKIEGSPAWAAYEEWYFDKYGKLPEDK